MLACMTGDSRNVPDALVTAFAQESSWEKDMLGDGFTQMTIPLSADPDGEGDLIATLVRYLPEGLSPEDYYERPALLYVHGLSDYFFQKHEATFFTSRGYAFYALDLRKCGRSHRPGQSWHYVSDLAYHFEELSIAATLIASKHDVLVPMGHSTGGLILPLWLNHLRNTAADGNPLTTTIAGLILNSPWLDMQYNPVVVAGAKVLGGIMSRVNPKSEVKGGNLSAYGESLSKNYHGEWDFNEEMKPVHGHPVYWGFLNTVMHYQNLIHEGKIQCDVPILALSSTKSWLNKPYSAATDTADVVIDVEHVATWSPKLGSAVDLRAIESARHDVFLSLPTPRKQAFEVTAEWLTTIAPVSH